MSALFARELGILAIGLCLVTSVSAQPSGSHSQEFMRLDTSSSEVKSAVQAAMTSERAKRERSLQLVSVISAERPAVSELNVRLCLSLDRDGRKEFARIVMSKNVKKQWSVDVWSWGSCGRR